MSKWTKEQLAGAARFLDGDCEPCAAYGELDDGFGNVWQKCKPGCQLEIVRPGKVQCDCDYRT